MSLSTDSLLALLQAARSAGSAAERRFVLLNRTREVLPYHAAVLWHPQRGLLGHSGSSHVDPLGPYGQWLVKLARACADRPAGEVEAAAVDEAIAADWAEWWPPHALWLPAPGGHVLLISRDAPWSPAEASWLAEWMGLWQLAEQAADAGTPGPAIDLRRLWRSARSALREGGPQRRKRLKIAAFGALAILLFPVKLTVRAPGELVPREPTVLRSTVDGIARKLHVEPNQYVEAGQLLAELDDAQAASKLQVARQALATAEAEWRQTTQQALNDARAKAQLAVARGRMEEKRTEVAYLSEQVRRTEVRALHNGVVLVDDPGNWAGRTVAAGEPLLRLAKPDDQEVEAWLPVGDAIELDAGSDMRLHLASRPASPVHATVRLYAYEAQTRPDGVLAYRVRGQLAEAARERLGSRGTAHIDGRRVPLIYWVLRRPLAALREVTGW